MERPSRPCCYVLAPAASITRGPTSDNVATTARALSIRFFSGTSA